MEELNRKVSQYSAAVSLNDSLTTESISMEKELKSQNDLILKTNSEQEKLRDDLDVVNEEIINEKLTSQQLKEDKFQCEDKLKKLGEEKLMQRNDNEKKCLEELHGMEEEFLLIRLRQEEEYEESDLNMKLLEAERDELYKKNEKMMLEKEKYAEMEEQLILSEESGRELIRQVEESKLNLRISERQKNELEENFQDLQEHLGEAEDESEHEKRYRKEQEDRLEIQAELEKSKYQLNDVLHSNNELRCKQQDASLEFTGYENDPINLGSQITSCYYNPMLIATVNTIATEGAQTAIYGMTSLHGMIYVVNDCRPEVEVYDMDSLCLKRSFIVDHLKEPRGIVSCAKKEVLYIVDGKARGEPVKILAVDVNGFILKRLWQGDDRCQLSVASDSNIILSVLNKKILEISPGGQLIREIKLSAIHPWHALKLSDDRYLLGCVGGLCIVNGDGKTISIQRPSHETLSPSPIIPINLAIGKAGTVFVVDEFSGRILLLTSDLTQEREFITREHGLKYPRRMILDEAKSRIFVADNSRKGRILIYDIGSDQSTIDTTNA